MKKYLLAALGLILFQLIAFAQDRCRITVQSELFEILATDTVYNTPRFIRFYEKSQPESSDDKKVIFKYFLKNDDYGLLLKRTENDLNGGLHRFYQVTYKDVVIDGSVIASHIYKSKIVSLSGTFIPVSAERQMFGITRENAIIKALSKFPSENYKWQNTSEEEFFKTINRNADASWYPKPEATYVVPGFNLTGEKAHAAWKMRIYSDEPLFAREVFIDAANGELLAFEDLIHEIDKPGKAKTRYSDTQNIVSDSLGAASYRLRETGRGGGIETYNMKKGTSYGTAVDFTDTDNFWNNVNGNQDEVATDAHWGAEETYDYFMSFFGRNSYDGNGAKIRSYVHYGSNYNNAFWNGSVMTYGDGNGSTFTPLTALDVCGHEVSHAVTTYTANLVYSYESGALNESFSDIFGNSIEKFSRPGKFDWKIGEDITPGNGGIRSMSNPNAKGQPDTYKKTLWYTGTGDNGGVHYNSGVQNFWYYLLCEGGIGKNDNNDSFWVDSLGMLKAQQIAYRNLSVYLSKNSQYADARFFAIQAAVDLYGNCSKEVIATTNAWHAVGVGSRYDSGQVKANFLADTFFCRAPATLTFVNVSLNTNKYNWSFGDGNFSTSTSPVHTYQNYGSYSVQLIAEGCFVNKKDTALKTAYIVIDSTKDICSAVLMPQGSWDTVSFCSGFIYDNGGEGNYKDEIRDTLTIAPPACDSIKLVFLDFDYENKFDSVFIYDGPSPASPKIGGYTGSTLPKAGLPIVSSGGSVTLIHFSDQLVSGRGFKAKITAYRPELSLSSMPDSLVCYKQPVNVAVYPKGGFKGDYLFRWNNVFNNDSVLPVVLTNDTSLQVELIDQCTQKRDTVNVNLTVRPPLAVVLPPDSILCAGNAISIKAKASGGLKQGYKYDWNSVNGDSVNTFIPAKDTTLTIVLHDGCSGSNAQDVMNITLLKPLSFTKSADTTICNSGMANLIVVPSGGNGIFTVNWNKGLGTGASKNITPASTSSYSFVLSDGCTVPSLNGTINVNVRPALSIKLPNDTVLCQGNGLIINPLVSGGDTANRFVRWNNTQIIPFLNVLSSVDTMIIAEAIDNCSPMAKDTVYISMLQPLKISLPANDTICVGQSRMVNASVSGGRSASRQVTFVGFGLINPLNISPLSTTVYTAFVSDGCTVKNDTANYTCYVKPPLSVEAGPDQYKCAGDTFTLMATASGGLGGGYNYSWSGGFGNSSTVTSTLLSSNRFYLVLNDGCSNYAIDSVDVFIQPSPQTDFIVQSSPVCAGRELIFRNQTNQTTNDVYEWNLGDGKTANTRDVTHAYFNEGFYDIALKVTNNVGCSKLKTIDSMVEVVAMPVPYFTVKDDVLPIMDAKLITINNSSKALTFQWDFGDMNSSTEISPEHIYTDTGWYELKLTAINRIGCDSSMKRWVWVRPFFKAWIPSAFTPTDVNQNNDYFKPVITAAKEYEMIVFNRWGEIVFKSDNLAKGWDGKHSDGTWMMPGNYFYYINVLDIDGLLHEYKGSFALLR